MIESRSDALAEIENTLQRAVVTDAYDAVDPLLRMYGEELEKQLRAASPELPALQERAHKLLSRVLAMLQVSRDDAYAKLEHLKVVSGYGRSSHGEPKVCADA